MTRPIFGDANAIALSRSSKKTERPIPERLQKREKNPERFPMTDDEKNAAIKLGGCRFGVGTWDKRFARDISSQAKQENPVITERQRYHLWRVVIRYHRQLPASLIQLAQIRLREIEEKLQAVVSIP